MYGTEMNVMLIILLNNDLNVYLILSGRNFDDNVMKSNVWHGNECDAHNFAE